MFGCATFSGKTHKPTVQTRIVILGGGFGGLYSALHFEKTIACDPSVEVTLVSRENFALFTPMLHEVAADDLDPSDIVSPLRQMLKHVRFVQAEWTASIWKRGRYPWLTASIANRIPSRLRAAVVAVMGPESG